MRAVAKSTTFQRPPDLSDTARWYCAVTRPGCQVRASLGLYELGYRTFYPTARRWVSHGRTKVAKNFPILNRYIFVEIDHPRQSFGMACLVNGVETILSSRGARDEVAPAAFDGRWIEDMRMRQMAGEWDATTGLIPVGARIIVLEGEFAGQLATVTGRKGHRIDFAVRGQQRLGRLQQCSVRAA